MKKSFTKELERISELETQLSEVNTRLEPLQDVVKTLEEKLYNYKKNSSFTISQILTDLGKTLGLDPESKVDLRFNDTYIYINITYLESNTKNFNSAIEISLKNYEIYNLSRNYKEYMEVFNPKEAKFEISSCSYRFEQDDNKSIDAQILTGFIASEFKKFNKETSIFDIFVSHMEEMYAIYDAIYDAKLPVYEVQAEVRIINGEIARIQKDINDTEFIQTMKESIGEIFVLKEDVNLRKVKNIGNLFNSSYYISHMQVVKVTDKTVTFHTGYKSDFDKSQLYFTDTKRVNKDDLQTNMQYIEKVDASTFTITNKVDDTKSTQTSLKS